jgi:hypothetical protein
MPMPKVPGFLLLFPLPAQPTLLLKLALALQGLNSVLKAASIVNMATTVPLGTPTVCDSTVQVFCTF